MADGAGRGPDVSGPETGGEWQRVFRWIGLFFIAYPILAIASTHPGPDEVILAGLATLLFVLLILLASQVPVDHPLRASWLGPAAVLGILTIAVVLVQGGHDTWFAFFFFASTGASPLVPRRRTMALIALSGVLAGGSVLALGGGFGNAALQGISVTAIGLLILSVSETRRANLALIQARHDLARLAVAEERSRIGRDLHDTLGHSLSLITLKSELAGRLLPDDPERARAEIADIERVARESLSAVRETVGGYRRPTLAVELAAARVALRAAGAEVRIEAPADPLPPAADEALAWAVREGVTNVVRHSRAKRVTIRVRTAVDRATVEVTDDGAVAARDPVDGRTAAADRTHPAAPGHGLIGLRERLTGAGGDLEAGPLDGGGYRLLAAVPLPSATSA